MDGLPFPSIQILGFNKCVIKKELCFQFSQIGNIAEVAVTSDVFYCKFIFLIFPAKTGGIFYINK